jgi:two-component system phosphate regulon sensor histidine kinase PhoR
MSAVAVFRRHEVEEVLQAALQTGEAARDLELGAVLEVRARRLPGGQLLVVVQDVTRERRAEAVRRDFVANVSHELRTPLASLRAMAETLRDGGLEDPQLRVRFLGQMLEEVDRMTRLVNDLLDLSALEAGVVRLRREELQARELLEAVARRYQQAASRRGVGLAVRPGEARLQGDRDRLEQALGNLVDNAVKYTPPGGRVELGVEAGGAEVRLVVEDTGPGVPPEHLPRIFERFYRADPSRSREEGGTGLGLAIAKHIALAHGGRVEACNRPEGGARFAVVLPAA